jgi:hypothetical protein
MMACVTAALLVLTGASVWEGAASIAPLGDLPDEGFYAATNSFPRNTVVDITNLETGQSIRVIVAAGLETPGLLAVLSRDAADRLGIRSRSIGRIRMTQPSDPVAFSRFTEGLASSGDPDYDPRALVNADPLAQNYIQNPPAAETPGAPASGGTGRDGETDNKTETGGAASFAPPRRDEIVDLPGGEEAPAAADPWAADPWEGPYTADAAETSESPNREEAPGLSIVEEPAAPPPPAPPPPALLPVPLYEEPEPEPEPEPVPESAIAHPVPEGAPEFGLVPAEERPPENGSAYVIPPELVIAPITEGSFPEQAAAPEPVPDESSFVDPLGTAPPESAALPEEVPAAPVPEIPEPPPLPGLFSVPVISGLEQGKYYLQIGAFSRAETVEALILKVGSGYPLAVQNGGSGESPVYRLLIGPMNLGESGALLQRFKSIGYSDAFVRSTN